ncbi:hypothetical protein [Enterococcus villorum]|nr:hypothetical protein [Enterococcus villorum]
MEAPENKPYVVENLAGKQKKPMAEIEQKEEMDESEKLKLKVKELDEYYHKLYKGFASREEKMKAQDDIIFVKKSIQKIKDDCREKSSFDPFSASKTLKKLGITRLYLETSSPLSEEVDYLIKRTYYGNSFAPFLSSNDSIDAIKGLKDKKLQKKEAVLKKYLKKKKQMMPFDIYKNYSRQYVEVLCEIEIRKAISKKLQELFGISEKELHLKRSLMKIPGVTRIKTEWNSLPYLKKKSSENEQIVQTLQKVQLDLETQAGPSTSGRSNLKKIQKQVPNFHSKEESDERKMLLEIQVPDFKEKEPDEKSVYENVDADGNSIHGSTEIIQPKEKQTKQHLKSILKSVNKKFQETTAKRLSFKEIRTTNKKKGKMLERG